MSLSTLRNRSTCRREENWVPVEVIHGARPGIVDAGASLRSWHDDISRNVHFKGTVGLERESGHEPPTCRIAHHDGTDQINGNAVDGTKCIVLPRTEWHPQIAKGVSDNMKGRLALMNFDGSDTKEGPRKIQILVPTKDGGHTRARNFCDAFEVANAEIKAGGLFAAEIGRKAGTPPRNRLP